MTDKDPFAPLPTVEDAHKIWEREVRERCRNRCLNCGSEDNLKIRMLVPENAGGQLVATNGTILCRACEMASESSPNQTPGDQRLVNFWVSHELFNRIKTGLDTYNAFSSMGALVRYLMSKFVMDPDRFEDLELFQDNNSTDCKINIWADKAMYSTFKAILDKKGWTVTSTLKSLIVLYSITAEDMIRPTNSSGGEA